MPKTGSPTVKTQPPALQRKLIAFDLETLHALEWLASDRMQEFQELADEAFRDILKKYHRPVTLKEALKQSRRRPAND